MIGADGLHSTTRRLAFGPESDHARHLGLYVATVPLNDRPSSGDVVMHNTPGKAVAVCPSPDGDIVFFLFRAPALPDFDHRDTGRHEQLLAAAFEEVGWRAPQLIDRVHATGDLYFDSVSQVDMPRWSNGRVARLGDAASCVSLFGDGSTLAMAGAFTLAEELAATTDPRTALQRYESTHRKLVVPKTRTVKQSAAFLAPATRPGLITRNTALRIAVPLASGANALLRRAKRLSGTRGAA